MNKNRNRSILFYPKLAAVNVLKNKKIYLPYILACIVTTAMYFIIHSLAENPGIDSVVGGSHVRFVLRMATRVTAFFSVIFLFYTSSFLMKQRKREFALYNILGMEKGHLGRLVFCETVDAAFLSLLPGLLFGALLNRLMFFLVLRIFRCEIPIGFHMSGKAFLDTFLLFGLIFLLIFLNNIRQLRFKSPMELLRDSQAGEREPKARWIPAILGLITLGAGYYLAVSIENPVAALSMFFGAVFLVIIGTYLLFTTGSIVILKLLRRKKNYYYKPNHFIAVSGMLYRMRQNAVGLANICILSTMVLVMVSSSLCLYGGLDDMMRERYPNNFLMESYDYSDGAVEKIKNGVGDLLESKGLSGQKEHSFSYVSFSALEKKGYFDTDTEGSTIGDMNALREIYVVTLDSYEALTGKKEVLESGEILLGDRTGKYKADSVNVFDREYKVKSVVGDFLRGTWTARDVAKTYVMVVKDREEFETLNTLQKNAYGAYASSPRYVYGFNLEIPEKEQIAFYEELTSRFFTPKEMGGPGIEVQINCRAVEKQDNIGIFGGLFFIGIFVGSLFIMATILIIYYKQIQEGYDDRERFAIMQKVGMSHSEVKRSIHSQIMTVFFLPLITAGIHVAVAFPFIRRVLLIFNMTNTGLFALCTLGSFFLFGAFYLVIYELTAKTYYKIVSR